MKRQCLGLQFLLVSHPTGWTPLQTICLGQRSAQKILNGLNKGTVHKSRPSSFWNYGSSKTRSRIWSKRLFKVPDIVSTYIVRNLIGILKIAWDRIPPGGMLCSEEAPQGLAEIYWCSKHSGADGKQEGNFLDQLRGLTSSQTHRPLGVHVVSQPIFSFEAYEEFWLDRGKAFPTVTSEQWLEGVGCVQLRVQFVFIMKWRLTAWTWTSIHRMGMHGNKEYTDMLSLLFPFRDLFVIPTDCFVCAESAKTGVKVEAVPQC